MAQQPGRPRKAKIRAVRSRGGIRPSGCRKEPEGFSWFQRCSCQGCPSPGLGAEAAQVGHLSCAADGSPESQDSGSPENKTFKPAPHLLRTVFLQLGRSSPVQLCFTKGEIGPERFRKWLGAFWEHDTAALLSEGLCLFPLLAWLSGSSAWEDNRLPSTQTIPTPLKGIYC